MHKRIILHIQVLAAVAFITLASCESSSKIKAQRRQEQAPAEEQTPKSEAKQDHFTIPQKSETKVAPKGLTLEEKALAKRLSRAYYMGLIASIRSLDDGISPAESIARAAISQNIQRMRDWKRAQMADILREFPGSGLQIEQAIFELPSRIHIDEAMAAVLTLRKQQKETVIEP
jgi:hypothetical protein